MPKRLSFKEWRQGVAAEPRIDDLISELIPGNPGYSLIAGPAGLGKTNLLLDMAFAMATGQKFLWFDVPRPTKVGYLAFEGAKQKLDERLGKLERTYKSNPLIENNLWFDRWPSTYIAYKQRREELLDWARGLDALILDPIKNMVQKDPSKTEVAHSFLENLKSIYEELGCHIILAHHVHKMDAELLYTSAAGDLQVLKGSTEYGDSAETVITLRRVQGRAGRGQFAPVIPGVAVLTLAKVRNQVEEMPMEETIQFSRDSLQWKWPVI